MRTRGPSGERSTPRTHKSSSGTEDGALLRQGSFRRLEGWVELGGHGSPQRGAIEIDARSISTRIPPRDWHLRTRDFLDVKRRPKIHVTVDAVERVDGELRIPASVSIHDLTRAVQLTAHLHRHGSAVAIHLKGALDRRAFEIRARRPFEWIVGREVLVDALVTVADAEQRPANA